MDTPVDVFVSFGSGIVTDFFGVDVSEMFFSFLSKSSSVELRTFGVFVVWDEP